MKPNSRPNASSPYGLLVRADQGDQAWDLRPLGRHGPHSLSSRPGQSVTCPMQPARGECAHRCAVAAGSKLEHIDRKTHIPALPTRARLVLLVSILRVAANMRYRRCRRWEVTHAQLPHRLPFLVASTIGLVRRHLLRPSGRHLRVVGARGAEDLRCVSCPSAAP